MTTSAAARTMAAALLAVLAAATSIGVDAEDDWPSHVGIVAFELNGIAVDQVAALGVGLVRGSCGWSQLEPARGVYDWRCADNVIVPATRRRLRTYMTVNCTPSWANAGAGCTHLPLDVADWFDFVEHFVGRYSGTNAVLGVWNEPNLSLSDDPSGDGYALLFINASAARNRIDPRFALGGPETSHHALASGYFARVVDRITALRAWNPGDPVTVHWYPDGPPLDGYMDAVHAVASGRDVWLTETGYSTPDLAQQAAFYNQTVTLFAGAARPWWTHLVFYRLWDGHDCCTEAILRGDYSRKPAFDELRTWLAPPTRGPEPRRREPLTLQ